MNHKDEDEDVYDDRLRGRMAKLAWHKWWRGGLRRLLASRDCACFEIGSFKKKSMTNCKIVFIVFLMFCMQSNANNPVCEPRVAFVLFQLPVLHRFQGLATKFPNTRFELSLSSRFQRVWASLVFCLSFKATFYLFTLKKVRLKSSCLIL